MVMVRFAQLCDKCGERSEEYTCWACCRECGIDICKDCSVDGTWDEDEGRIRALCVECYDMENEE